MSVVIARESLTVHDLAFGPGRLDDTRLAAPLLRGFSCRVGDLFSDLP